MSCRLRDLLGQAASVGAVEEYFASSASPFRWRELFIPHVRDVLDRVDLAAGDDDGLWTVKLAALVHEVPPGELPAMLGSGFPDAARQVQAIVEGFGAIWKANDERGIAGYVRQYRCCLCPLLLFEVAHEGEATPSMIQAAKLGGIAEVLDRWQRRLAGRSPVHGRD